MRLLSIFMSLNFIIFSSARFFDVCPGRRQSIGACLVGLCPAGSECINSYCCKIRKETTTAIDVLIDETTKLGACKNGMKSIGECISNICPSGYKCEKGICCGSKKGDEIPMKSSPISVITVAPEESVEQEQEETENTTDVETDDISKETNSTFAPDKEIVDEEDAELEEDEEDKTTTPSTTTSTTQRSTTTIGDRRRKSKRVKSKKPKSATRRLTTTPSTTRSTTSTTTLAPTTVTEEEEREEREELEKLEMTTLPDIDEFPEEPKFVCPVGAPIGECIANRCPEGHGCVEGQCCILTPQINCTDQLTGCLSHLCDRKGYTQFMTKNCAKTCARCHLVNITPTEIRQCRDRRSDCEEWSAEGFCESSLYTTRQKLKFCGKSCKLC